MLMLFILCSLVGRQQSFRGTCYHHLGIHLHVHMAFLTRRPTSINISLKAKAKQELAMRQAHSDHGNGTVTPAQHTITLSSAGGLCLRSTITAICCTCWEYIFHVLVLRAIRGTVWQPWLSHNVATSLYFFLFISK
jgi:hypothetical protein